ncbi:hypothetical protein RFI_32056, partial [Reticulomyxa filosa]
MESKTTFVDIRVEQFLPINFNEKIKELKNKFGKCFHSLQHKFKRIVENMDIAQLFIVFDVTNIFANEGTFLQQVKYFFNSKLLISTNDNDNSSDPITVKLWTYSDMVRDLNFHLNKMTQEITNDGMINDKTKTNDADRDRFFGHLKKKLDFIEQVSQLKIQVNNTDMLLRCQMRFKSEMQDCVESIKEKLNWTTHDYQQINIYYLCLSCMQKHGVFSDIVGSQISAVNTLVHNRIEQLKKGAMDNLNSVVLTPYLLAMKEMSIHILNFKDIINKDIDGILHTFKLQKSGANIAILAIELEKDLTGIGEMIVTEHLAFKGYLISLFNTKTKAIEIDHVLEKIKSARNQNAIDTLKKRYDEFDKEYNKLISKHLVEKEPNFTVLTSNAKKNCRRGKQNLDNITWDATIRDSMSSLLAHIFALWTLQNSQYYHDANGVDDKESYLLKPHAAQVIAIFCMLGIDEGKPGLINNFVQIGTGEGKSITLAVTACALALFGFDVGCASYSEYLSCRDLKIFEPLFNAFGVADHIHYGTFNQLCERLINDEGDVRKLVEHLLLSGEDRKEEQIFFNETARTARAKILLIDEVDIFFSKEFYGSFYSPAATLRHDTIIQLIDFIWSNREPRLTLNKVRESLVYRACCNILKGWDLLLDEAIKDMLRDVYTFASQSYQVSNDKIRYKDQNSISYNVRYGYKTLFAYYHEHQQAKISDESFKQNVFISFQIGSFSYAEVPKNGTLTTLSDIEKNVVEEDYRVSKFTYIPSLFGEHKLSFAEKPDIIIEDESIYFNALKTEIDCRLVGKMGGTKRAVLVFFDSIKSLNEFYESVDFAPMKSTAIVMTEENSFAEKESLIKRATTSGQIGLFTKSFGRGTDFACHDQI